MGSSDRARADAIERFETFAAGLERFSLEAFRTVAMRVRDPDDRDRLTREAVQLADTAGIGDVVERARGAVADHVMAAYDGGIYRPALIALNWGMSNGPTEDRVAVVQAVQDAVTAAVLGPLAPAALVSALAAAYDDLASGPLAPAEAWRSSVE